MKKLVLGTLFAALAASGAVAADLGAAPAPAPTVGPWDFAVGGGLTSNYLFRGISQSNNRPSVSANGELRYNINSNFQLYAGVAGESIKLTQFDQSPTMELDLMGGARATFGNLSADFGAIKYVYPGLGATPTPNGIFPTNPGFFEVYSKLGYKINDMFSVGANAYYTPSFLDTGANGTYISGTAKVSLPHDFALSGEFGRQFFGRTNLVHGNFKMPDYNYWNAGISYTYKIATLDLRYHGTDLNKFKCNLITGPTNVALLPSSKYCGSTFVATLSFALEGKDLK